MELKRAGMLKGIMNVLEDSTSKEMIWQDSDTMYYSKGGIDPDYCVLKFIARAGPFYNNFNSNNFDVE